MLCFPIGRRLAVAFGRVKCAENEDGGDGFAAAVSGARIVDCPLSNHFVTLISVTSILA